MILFAAYAFVGLAGASVGLAELVSRYRDAPTRALYTRPAFLYLATNAVASIGALFITLQFGWKFGIDTTDAGTILLVQSLVAGFGAIAFFRSSLFNLRVGDRDVSVGPHIVLQVILEASDRGVDRDRGTDRANEVELIMREVSFERSFASLPTFCLALMQNLSDEAQKKLGEDMRDLREAALDESVKSLVLGLALMNAVGYDVLQGAVKSLGPRIRRVRAIEAAAAVDIVLGVDCTIPATPLDFEKNPLPVELLVWSSDTPTVATTTKEGRITGVLEGAAQLAVSADGVTHRIRVRVLPMLIAVPVDPAMPDPIP